MSACSVSFRGSSWYCSGGSRSPGALPVRAQNALAPPTSRAPSAGEDSLAVLSQAATVAFLGDAAVAG
jgi:hypothetical protein